MVRVELGGREWRFITPDPAVALRVYNMTQASQDEVMRHVLDLLMDYMDFDDWVEFDYGAGVDDEGLDDPVVEALFLWLETSLGRPFSAVATLCAALVGSWPQVRGRLVTSGIANPAEDIRTLGGLVDAVEFMIMEGHKDDKAREKYKREVYKPRARRGKVQKPSGFDSSDMAAQASMLEALDSAGG